MRQEQGPDFIFFTIFKHFGWLATQIFQPIGTLKN